MFRVHTYIATAYWSFFPLDFSCFIHNVALVQAIVNAENRFANMNNGQDRKLMTNLSIQKLSNVPTNGRMNQCECVWLKMARSFFSLSLSGYVRFR